MSHAALSWASYLEPPGPAKVINACTEVRGFSPHSQQRTRGNAGQCRSDLLGLEGSAALRHFGEAR